MKESKNTNSINLKVLGITDIYHKKNLCLVEILLIFPEKSAFTNKACIHIIDFIDLKSQMNLEIKLLIPCNYFALLMLNHSLIQKETHSFCERDKNCFISR